MFDNPRLQVYDIIIAGSGPQPDQQLRLQVVSVARFRDKTTFRVYCAEPTQCGYPVDGPKQSRLLSKIGLGIRARDHSMTPKKRIWLSLVFALIVYWLLNSLLLIAAMRGVGGHFGYPLDDTYIHMAIGKHFVQDGVWGVADTGFSSSTSSPLWTFLVAVTYKMVGVNDWSPLALASLFGSLTICFCYYVLHRVSNLTRLTLSLTAIIVVVPLSVLTLTGMEHTLHGLLTLLLMYCAAGYLAKDGFHARWFIALILLANLTAVTRYEGLLLVLSVVLLLIFSKRVWEGLLLGAGSLLLVTAYGCLSLANGWYFLPNSILLKGNTPPSSLQGLPMFVVRMLTNFYSSPHILVLLIACLSIYLWHRKRFESNVKYLVILAALATFLHMQFADTGWFFRYEAYLVLALTVILLDAINRSAGFIETTREITDKYIVALMLLIVICIPLVARVTSAMTQYRVAVRNINEQQYQMGLFAQTYYAGRHIAANDIGAISYLADAHTLDLYGLANMEVLQHKLNDSFGKDSIEQLVSGSNVSLVMIYDEWFAGTIPDDWVKVGKWTISDNVVCASDNVSFYAPDDSYKQEAVSNLVGFSGTLPPTVDQSGIYVSPETECPTSAADP